MSDRNGSEEWITIAEAARQIGVTERSLRRLLARPDYAARTRRENRRTPSGQRQSTLLPAALLPDLNAHYERQKETAQDGAEETAGADYSLLAQLRSENAFLRAELTAQRETHAQAEAEMRRLMATDRAELMALRQRLALPPYDEAAQEAQKDAPEAVSVEKAAGESKPRGGADCSRGKGKEECREQPGRMGKTAC
jgi:hypothetical protein